MNAKIEQAKTAVQSHLRGMDEVGFELGSVSPVDNTLMAYRVWCSYPDGTGEAFFVQLGIENHVYDRYDWVN